MGRNFLPVSRIRYPILSSQTQRSKMAHPLKDYYQDIYRNYDLVNRIFTFGQDHSWRKKAVMECLADNPEWIIDICTGTGDLILEIARNTDRKLELTGYDFTAEMLQVAMKKAARMKVDIEFIEGDVAQMPFTDNRFDAAGITFGIRNLLYENANASAHLAEIGRVLKPGGRLVILESSKPGNRIWRVINGFYLRFILPYLGGFISGNMEAYRYLARSSKNYYTIPEMKSILESSGFHVIKYNSLFLGSVMLMVAENQK